MKKCACLAGLLAILFISCSPAVVYAFSDTAQHWARPQIDHLSNRGLVSGYPDGTYGPDRYVSRAEFVTLLGNALNKSLEAKELSKGESSFYDCAGHWAMGYIELARELNIAHGDGRGRFNPGVPVSREEAVTMMVNSVGIPPADLPPAAFSDQAAISTWAEKPIDYAVYNDLIHGYPDNSFQPARNLTRAEVAAMLEQFLALQGQRYHFYGTLEEIELSLRRAVVKLDGRTETFQLASDLTAYRKGENQPLTQIDLPADAYFTLNGEGKLAYFYITDDKPDTLLNIRRLSLPGAEKINPAESNIVRLTEELEEVDKTSVLSRPQNSMEATAAAMRVQEFADITGASGRAQMVAVIDSGLDPGHPDLQTTSEGFRKIVDFIDLSDEGRVNLVALEARDGYLDIGERRVDVSGLDNNSNEYRYGFFDLSFLPPEFGLLGKQLLTVVTAGRYANVFDTIYLDTDFDGQISDQLPLRQYSRQGETAVITGGNRSFNLLLAEISDQADFLKLGFDMLGHGTEVAGIVAARGEIMGMAPDAQLLPVKVMDRSGTTSLKKIESALSLASERGAKVAVVSIGQYQIKEAEMDSLTRLLANIEKVSGMLVCMAAGNGGPGLGSVAETASLSNVISVGAYATPEMWSTDYGWQVDEPTLWYFSSSGPAADGSAAPRLLAPGNAVSAYPLWTGQAYRLDEGSSIAAPHLAGAAALLLEAGAKLGLSDGRSAGRALLAGAEPLPGFQAAEQGLGAVNLMRAWNEMRTMEADTGSFSGEQFSPGLGYGGGFYSRGQAPGELTLKLTNNGNTSEQLSVGSLADWIVPRQYMVGVPANATRTVDIKYEGLSEPGLYSSFLVADKYNTPEWDVAMLQTVVIPYELDGGEGFLEETELSAGQFKRYFFRVPEGFDNLSFRLSSSNKGRVRMHVISPAGVQEVSQYSGVGDVQVTASVSMHYRQPEAGIWELVVYSSTTLSDYDLKSSQYKLEVMPDLNGMSPALPSDNKYLITAVPPQLKAGERGYITLYFWYAGSKQPAAGLVSIDGRLYEIRNGMVKLEVEGGEAADEIVNLNVAW